jgi:hypothetical protein
MLFEESVLGNVARKDIVGSEITAVKGEEKVAQPGVRGFSERVQDRVQEQFTEIVDGV